MLKPTIKYHLEYYEYIMKQFFYLYKINNINTHTYTYIHRFWGVTQHELTLACDEKVKLSDNRSILSKF